MKAVDPGLVYEASKEKYIKMLCSLGDAGNITSELAIALKSQTKSL